MTKAKANRAFFAELAETEKRAAEMLAAERGTDMGPHHVTAHGITTYHATLVAAIREYDDAGRWASGFRWLTHTPSKRDIMTDNR